MLHRSQKLALTLDAALSISRLEKTWRKTVRNGLRRQPCTDLHDYLDIHRNIRSICETLRADVLSGHHRASAPEFVTLEKRDGVSRRLAIPSPQDALVVQSIIDVLEPVLLSKKPTERAYYSRTHQPTSFDEIDSSFSSSPWWVLWPEFQKRIWEFSGSHKYLVNTDIANYFDCISLDLLRNAISSMGDIEEELLDLLFFLLEGFSWRPFYIPHPRVGLPQINFDAPRLLAHVYLFKIDAELNEKTGGDFVRWMDDINAGVDSPADAKVLLRDLEIVLNSQGLRINAGKTKILSAEHALKHFRVKDNRSLTIIDNAIKSGTTTAKARARRLKTLKSQYRKFRRTESVGQWDKVMKRYYTLFGKLDSRYLRPVAQKHLQNKPGVRSTALRYIRETGYTRKSLEIICDWIKSGHITDDVALIEAAITLVDWPMPASQWPKAASMADHLAPRSGPLAPSSIISAIWLLGKYAPERELGAFLRRPNVRDLWRKSSWVARQVAAVTPMLFDNNRRWIEARIVMSGQREALAVLANIWQLQSIKRLGKDKQLKMYLEHPASQKKSYPFYKVLVARAILDGEMPIKSKADLRQKVRFLVKDPRYYRLLSRSRPAD